MYNLFYKKKNISIFLLKSGNQSFANFSA